MQPLIAAALLALASADPYESFHGVNGRDVQVQLFEWKWTDVVNECETFLAKYGYGGVQVSPPNEHIYFLENGDMPWYIDYQPVSYNIVSRRGSRAEFQDMVNRCNKAGVRVIVNAVINHMVGDGQSRGKSGVSSWGSCNFTGEHDNENFPCVPYDKDDFNDPICDHDIQPGDYTCCANNVRRCRLVGLLDLNHNGNYVRSKIAAFFNDLIDMGVAGFRIDAAKHMYPGDIAAILAMTKNLREDIFGPNQRAFSAQEVIDYGGEAVKASEYVNNGRICNFRAGRDISDAVNRKQNFKYYGNWGYGWYPWSINDVETFIDDHDTQRNNPTCTSNCNPVTYKAGKAYQMANGFLLAKDYGVPRVMSSYTFTQHDVGPPHNADWTPSSPTFNPDETCNTASGWQCEHRWPIIRRMVQFHNAVNTGIISNIVDDEDHRLAFARGDFGFFALNNGFSDWTRTFQTKLPEGFYCDVYHHNGNNSNCNGPTIQVHADGTASIKIPQGDFVAIYKQK